MKIYVNKGNYGWQTRAINGEDKMYIMDFSQCIKQKQDLQNLNL